MTNGSMIVVATSGPNATDPPPSHNHTALANLSDTELGDLIEDIEDLLFFYGSNMSNWTNFSNLTNLSLSMTAGELHNISADLLGDQALQNLTHALLNASNVTLPPGVVVTTLAPNVTTVSNGTNETFTTTVGGNATENATVVVHNVSAIIVDLLDNLTNATLNFTVFSVPWTNLTLDLGDDTFLHVNISFNLSNWTNDTNGTNDTSWGDHDEDVLYVPPIRYATGDDPCWRIDEEDTSVVRFEGDLRTCLPNVQKCYCDAVTGPLGCDSDRHVDCCLKCWPETMLDGCDWEDDDPEFTQTVSVC